MAKYTKINQPFTIPEGFDVKRTDIQRCKINPKLGYLKPKKDVVYSFLMTKGKSGNFLKHGDEKEMEAYLTTNPEVEIRFVSPFVDEPEHHIGWGDVGPYWRAMKELWESNRYAELSIELTEEHKSQEHLRGPVCAEVYVARFIMPEIQKRYNLGHRVFYLRKDVDGRCHIGLNEVETDRIGSNCCPATTQIFRILKINGYNVSLTEYSVKFEI